MDIRYTLASMARLKWSAVSLRLSESVPKYDLRYRGPRLKQEKWWFKRISIGSMYAIYICYIYIYAIYIYMLYMVCHGSHPYTLVMLALIYQHHGSVMGYGGWWGCDDCDGNSMVIWWEWMGDTVIQFGWLILTCINLQPENSCSWIKAI